MTLAGSIWECLGFRTLPACAQHRHHRGMHTQDLWDANEERLGPPLHQFEPAIHVGCWNSAEFTH